MSHIMLQYNWTLTIRHSLWSELTYLPSFTSTVRISLHSRMSNSCGVHRFPVAMPFTYHTPRFSSQLYTINNPMRFIRCLWYKHTEDATCATHTSMPNHHHPKYSETLTKVTVHYLPSNVQDINVAIFLITIICVTVISNDITYKTWA
jgi:hypothetical protein